MLCESSAKLVSVAGVCCAYSLYSATYLLFRSPPAQGINIGAGQQKSIVDLSRRPTVHYLKHHLEPSRTKARHQMPQYLLLSVGLDPLLMRTRTVLLGEAGYSVLPSFTSRDAFEIFVSRDIDLVILCHTIPEQEKMKLIVSMKERIKRTPIVSIHADGETDGKLVDAYVHGLDGPEALLCCIANVLDGSIGRQIAI